MNKIKSKRLGLGLAVVLGALAGALPAGFLLAQTALPKLPDVHMRDDGTIEWSAREIPLPSYASPEAHRAYIALFKPRLEGNRAAAAAAPGSAADPTLASLAASINADKMRALKNYPDIDDQETTMGGIKVSVYTPKAMPAANKDKVALEFEVDSEGVQVAHFAQQKVISVHYRLRPAGAGNQDIVSVYRDVLKSYKPRKVAFFGTSGGCTFAITTAVWLPLLKLPEPGALGLMTCSGGSQPGDTRITNNGLDPLLSTITRGQPPRVGPPPPEAPYDATHPPATALDGAIPEKGFPAAFLMSGTRDMCLSQTVLLHRKLRRAGVKTELYVAEGMWHGFHGDSDLPESKEAMQNFSRFLKENL